MNSHGDNPTGPEFHDDDTIVGEWLGTLDPGSDDDRYWERFHGNVLARARSELARRRAAAEPSVMELVSSWSKTVVPAALAAAAVAAFLLVKPGPDAPTAPGHMSVEEMLAVGVEEEPVPARPFLEATGTEALAVFAAEIF